MHGLLQRSRGYRGTAADKHPTQGIAALTSPHTVPKSSAPWPVHQCRMDSQRETAQFKGNKMCFFLLNKLVYIW